MVDALIAEAFHGRNKLAALSYIFDRLEGRPRQQVDVKDICSDLRSRSDSELEYYIANGHWPEEDQPFSVDQPI